MDDFLEEFEPKTMLKFLKKITFKYFVDCFLPYIEFLDNK